MTIIPEAEYRRMAAALPILCVDVVLRNRAGKVLLLKRGNEPKKGRWWPVGGRVLRGESLPRAAIRKVREETGLAIRDPQPAGYFELVARRGPFGVPGYHTVSIVFSATVPDGAEVVLDGQSTGWKFAPALPADFRVVPFSEGEGDVLVPFHGVEGRVSQRRRKGA